MSAARDVAVEITKNGLMAIPTLRDYRISKTRTSLTFAPDALERYAFAQLNLVRRVLGDIRDRSIVEIGPGDHLGSGLSFLAAGAATYTSIDRFPGNYRGESAKQWYAGIRDAWPSHYPDLPWLRDLDPGTFPEAYSSRVTSIGMPIERYAPASRFDVVFSFDVGEHVSDIWEFARATSRLLNPNGTAIHRVNFGPHGCWEQYPDPLIFLRFPDWCWQLMGSHRGLPNRRRFHELADAFDKAGLTTEVLNRQVFDTYVDPRRLTRRFQSMPLDSLTTSSAVFVCRHR